MFPDSDFSLADGLSRASSRSPRFFSTFGPEEGGVSVVRNGGRMLRRAMGDDSDDAVSTVVIPSFI